MAISDAQFLAYLRGKGGGRLTVLAEIEFAYESGGALATGMIYLSDRPYITQATDSPSSTRYRDVIISSPESERSIDIRKLGGRGVMSVGSLRLNNADGSVDFLLDVIIDGREVRFYVGDYAWPRSDFRLANVAVVESVKAGSDTELTITLRDKNYLLDDTIIGDAIATGPNAGKPKPVLMGVIKNFDISPYLYDTASLKYYINNFAMPSNIFVDVDIEVRDAGVSLGPVNLFTFSAATMTADAGTDTLTKASAHNLSVNDVVVFLPGTSIFAGLAANTQYWVISAGLTATDFRLSLTKGGGAVDITGTAMSGTWALSRRRFYIDGAAATIELSATPAGRVTMDLSARDAGGVITVAGQGNHIIKYILQNHSSLSPTEYDTSAIDSLAYPATLACQIAVLDRENVLDLLDRLFFVAVGWYGWSQDGDLMVGQLDLVDLDGASSIDDIVEDDISDMQVENLALPWGKVSLTALRNLAVQADGLSASVTADNRSLWGQQFQVRVSTTDPGTLTYLDNWWDYHKSAIDSRPMECAVSNVIDGLEGGSQSVCDAITTLFKPWTRVYRCNVGLDKYALNPGDCVTLTYPRYGLESGAKVRVMSVKTRLADQETELVMVRQVTPDYTTASYY